MQKFHDNGKGEVNNYKTKSPFCQRTKKQHSRFLIVTMMVLLLSLIIVLFQDGIIFLQVQTPIEDEHCFVRCRIGECVSFNEFRLQWCTNTSRQVAEHLRFLAPIKDTHINFENQLLWLNLGPIPDSATTTTLTTTAATATTCFFKYFYFEKEKKKKSKCGYRHTNDTIRNHTISF
jgi:hypothetical protein